MAVSFAYFVSTLEEVFARFFPNICKQSHNGLLGYRLLRLREDLDIGANFWRFLAWVFLLGHVIFLAHTHVDNPDVCYATTVLHSFGRVSSCEESSFLGYAACYYLLRLSTWKVFKSLI